MNVRSVAKAGLVLMAAWAFVAGPAAAQQLGRVKQQVPLFTSPKPALQLSNVKRGLQTVAAGACVENTFSCGQTRTGELTADDCQLGDDSLADVWFFNGTAGQTVTVNLTSNAFDAYLLLADPDFNAVAEDDDGGAGATDARLVFTLDTTGEWAVIANAFAAGETGPYTVSIACTGGGGGGSAPAAPSNLTGSATSSTEVALAWRDNSNNETSFRVESRVGNSGAFTDIGSVPANSTGADIVDLAPATTYSFRVRARNANGNSAYTNVVTVTTQSGGGGGFITTPEFPDFRFRIQINDQPARRENDCLPDTLCVSGAVPGRSEVFVRIVGPRPNGFLWPNIIKFTTSRVEVEIQQISTGVTKTYILPGVDPSSDDLTGFFDRMGFPV